MAILSVPVFAQAPNTKDIPSWQMQAVEILMANGITDGTDLNLIGTIWRCESGWRPNAQNAISSAGGLGQFIDSTWAKWGEGDKYDPLAMAKATALLYKAQGTRPWLASQSCWK
jgi:hypothetical protein